MANLIIGLFCTIFLLLLNAVLASETAAWIFSESGLFEMLSFIFWYVLTLTLLLTIRPLNRFVVFMALLSFMAGCRPVCAGFWTLNRLWRPWE